jgi:hypothetical protein
VTRRPEKSPSAEVRALGFRIARHVGSSHRILRRHERRHIHRPRHRRLPIAPRAPGALTSHCLVNQSLCVGDLTPPANASDLPIELDVGGIACNATRIGLSCRVMIGRRAFGMILRSLAREGRRRCHKYHAQARDQSSHLTSPADFPQLAYTCGTSEGEEDGRATVEPTLEGEARRQAMPQSMAAPADQSDRIPSTEARPALYRQPASPAPSSRRSARIAQMDKTDPCCSLTPRRS